MRRQIIVRAATLSKTSQIKLAISPDRSVLRPAPDRILVSKSVLVWLDRRKQGTIIVPPALREDSLLLDRLAGLVLKASVASRGEDPGEGGGGGGVRIPLAPGFFRVESYQ